MAGPSAQVEMTAWMSRRVPTSTRGQACVRFVVCRFVLVGVQRFFLLRLSPVTYAKHLGVHTTQTRRGRDNAASMLPLLF